MLEYKLKKIPDIMIFSFAIPPTLIPLVFGYLWLFLLLYSIVVFVLFLFSRENGLIINHKGISNLINLKHARWDVIGGYKDNVHFNDFFHKGGLNGIGIIHRDEVNNPDISSEYHKGNYVMFIDKDRIAANDHEIKEILDQCIDHYVKGIDNSGYQIEIGKTFSVDALKQLALFLVYLFGSKYVYDQIIIINDSDIKYYSLWILLTSIITCSFPYVILGHKYKISTFFQIIGILYVLFLYFVVI